MDFYYGLVFEAHKDSDVMAQKPTYDDLLNKVAALEKELDELKEIKHIADTSGMFQEIIERSFDGIILGDLGSDGFTGGNGVIYISPAVEKIMPVNIEIDITGSGNFSPGYAFDRGQSRGDLFRYLPGGFF